MTTHKTEAVKAVGEGIAGAMKDWAALALAGLGINLALHEFLGGLLLALAAAMVARHWAPERTKGEVWLVLLTAALAAVVTAEMLPLMAPHWPAQMLMAASGFFSRFVVQFLLSVARQVQRRSDEVTDKLLDRVLPPGERPPHDREGKP